MGQGKGDHGEDVIRVIEGPVVDRADPFDPESRTAELSRHGSAIFAGPGPVDRLVPPADAGFLAWSRRVGGALRRSPGALLMVAALGLLPMYFFTGRVDDTVVIAPALVDLAGGFGLLLLPIMWLAYFAVAALPLVFSVAGAVGVALPAAADGRTPGFGKVWSLVVYRLRPLWLWLAGPGVVTQVLPLVTAAGRLDAGVAVPLIVVLGLISTGVLTFGGMLGCVVLIERGHGPRRALHLLSIVPTGGLIAAALAATVLPRVADLLSGSFAATAVGVLTAVGWAVAALVTYAQARRSEGPVTSASLRAELATPDVW